MNSNDKDKIIKQLANSRKRIDDKYAYLEFSKKLLNQIYNNALNKALKIQDNSSSLSKKVNYYYTLEYKKQIQEILKNTPNTFLIKITNHYIKNNKLQNIQSLIAYFNELVNIYPNITFDNCLFLIENYDIITKILKKEIYNDGKVNTKKLNSLFETNLSIILDLFCQINNIALNEPENYNIEYDHDSENYFSSDIVEDFIKKLPKKVLSYEEVNDCMEKIQAGNQEARDYLFKHNLRLVISVTKKYHSKSIPFMDLIQEGSIGLMTAIDRYDYKKGYKFSTYATWWIRQSITRYIENNGRMIKLPVYLENNINKINRVKKTLTNTLQREPTNLELAVKLGIPLAKLNSIFERSQEVISYNVPISEDDNEKQLADFINDTKANIENNYIDSNLKDILHPFLEKLTKEEQIVLKYRFGLDGMPILTLAKIGKILNISGERVRQLQNRALQKLCSDVELQKHKNYLDYPDTNSDKIIVKNNTHTLFKTLLMPKVYAIQALNYLEEDEIDVLQETYGINYEKRAYIDKNNKKLVYAFNKLSIIAKYIKNKRKCRVVTKSLLEELKTSNLEKLANLINELNENDRRILFRKYKDIAEDVKEVFDQPLECYFYYHILLKLKKALKEDAIAKDSGGKSLVKKTT